MSTAWAITVLVGAAFCTFVISIFHSLLSGEVRAWLPHLARRLVRGAARQLPVDSRARYEADWLAELVAWQDRPISALAKAAHIRWKAREIQESLGGVQVRGEGAKRALDLFVATSLLFLLAPLLLATAIAIKFDSRGPVFFRQRRAGRGDRSFYLFKFRTMVPNADDLKDSLRDRNEAQFGLFKIADDPRVTRVGKFLRKTALDELPQLVNVVRGEMSLVGPRPMLPNEVAALKEEGELGRTEVRPGLTGPRQIQNFRGPYTVDEGREMDEEYARSRSLLLDLRLLAHTVWAVLRRP